MSAEFDIVLGLGLMFSRKSAKVLRDYQRVEARERLDGGKRTYGKESGNAKEIACSV